LDLEEKEFEMQLGCWE